MNAAEKCETVNPIIKNKTFFYTEVVKMDDLRFPSRPDQTLRGNRYHKRQMIPVEETTSDDVAFPRESYLWKSNRQNTEEFEAHFDSKSFLQTHGHLLPPSSDHSAVELEKNLRNRRRRINTTSSVDSKPGHGGFTSNDEAIGRMEMHSPYDELTYEETLFEVDDDRIQARSVTSHDDDESEPASVNRNMVLSLNRRKRQRINNKELEMVGPQRSYSGQTLINNLKQRDYSEEGRHLKRKSLNDSTNLKIAYQAKQKQKPNFGDQESADDMIPEDILEEYIEERIRAVEIQIRNEVLRDSQNLKRNNSQVRNFSGNSLLDKVPEQYSVELEQADESSRDSLLKEIAAVLVSKGYVANVESGLKVPREILRIAKDKGFQHDLKRRAESAVSDKSSKRSSDLIRSRPLERRNHKRESTISPPSTFKSHKESSRQHTSLDSEKSSMKHSDNRTSEGADARRRKFKSSGSRSSLTSLIRTPDSSSSSDENISRRNHVKRSLSSSKISSIVSNDSIKKNRDVGKKDGDPYDNVLFKRNPAEEIGSQKQGSNSNGREGSVDPQQRHYEFSNLNQPDACLKNLQSDEGDLISKVKEPKIVQDQDRQMHHIYSVQNSISQEADGYPDSGSISMPPVCPPPPSSTYSGSSSFQKHGNDVTSNSTSLTVLEQSSTTPPAPPPRRKNKPPASVASAGNERRKNPSLVLPQTGDGIYGNHLGSNSRGTGTSARQDPGSACSALHGDRSASEFFVMDDHATGRLFRCRGLNR